VAAENGANASCTAANAGNYQRHESKHHKAGAGNDVDYIADKLIAS
jgi:hypothetical protein